MRESTTELPDGAIDEAEQLTRRAKAAVDPGEADAYRARRDELLESHGFVARIRSEEEREVLVLHPSEWVSEDRIDVEAIDDIDRAVEVPLSGPGEADAWETVEQHNRELAAAVADKYGDPHGATAHALADFAGNHYVKPIEELTTGELDEFRTDYLVRNAWPTEAQMNELDESLRLIAATVESPFPAGEKSDSV